MPLPPKYQAQALADKISDSCFCSKRLFLSLAHPELNTIETLLSNMEQAAANSILIFEVAVLEDVQKAEMHKLEPENIAAIVWKKNRSIRK